MDFEASPSILSLPSSNTFIREFLASFSSVESGATPVFGYVLFSEPSETETDPPFVGSKRHWFDLENSILGMQQWGRGLLYPVDNPLKKTGPESHFTCRGSLK